MPAEDYQFENLKDDSPQCACTRPNLLGRCCSAVGTAAASALGSEPSFSAAVCSAQHSSTAQHLGGCEGSAGCLHFKMHLKMQAALLLQMHLCMLTEQRLPTNREHASQRAVFESSPLPMRSCASLISELRKNSRCRTTCWVRMPGKGSCKAGGCMMGSQSHSPASQHPLRHWPVAALRLPGAGNFAAAPHTSAQSPHVSKEHDLPSWVQLQKAGLQSAEQEDAVP